MPRRGRPSIALTDRLRVSVWSHLVLLASGLNEIQELEAHFASEPGLRLSSGLWSRYMLGRVIPQGALEASRSTTLVHRVEKFLPGTAGIFFSPVWSLIEWDPKVDFEMIRLGYISLGKGVAPLFLDDTYPDYGEDVRRHVDFWSRRRTVETSLTVFNKLDAWDRLTACLLESRMSYAAQDPNSFAFWQLLAGKTLAVLQEKPEFQGKQLRSALLTMEFMVLLSLSASTRHSDCLTTKFEYQRTEWINNWETRVRIHFKHLPNRSRAEFINMIEKVKRLDWIPSEWHSGTKSS